MAARKQQKAKEEAASFVVSTENGLNVRKEPSKQSEVMKILPYGATVVSTGEAPEGWVAIDGGFVMKQYLK